MFSIGRRNRHSNQSQEQTKQHLDLKGSSVFWQQQSSARGLLQGRVGFESEVRCGKSELLIRAVDLTSHWGASGGC